MISFLICLAALIVAYFTYGKYLSRLARLDDAQATPCQRMADGVDYIAMPAWRVFMVQLLNIAGTGPIFGAILGACFGPVAFLWITLGGIFFGGLHDFMSGVMITRHDGRSIPEVVGVYLGKNVRGFMRVFSVILLLLVGTVFVVSPAQLLAANVASMDVTVWVWIILAYYIVATLLPVDKIIGRLYPLFGVALILMALCLLGVLLFGPYHIPEINFHNYQLNPGALPIIPTLFITIACGAISGFHATQSPLMARCVTRESECRAVFYGAMISESIIALIWAAIAMAFFGGAGELASALGAQGNSAAWGVDVIAKGSLGKFGFVLAVLGVVAAPITSGDTAFRSARLTIADWLHIDQRPVAKRLAICIPIFAIGFGLTLTDFGVLWRYFAWCNQALATIVLWAIFMWMGQRRSATEWVVRVPAVIMTYVVCCFALMSPQMLGIDSHAACYGIAGILSAGIWLLMEMVRRRHLEHKTLK